MDTAELVKDIAIANNKMFQKGIEHGRIQAFQEILNFIQAKLMEIEKGGKGNGD